MTILKKIRDMVQRQLPATIEADTKRAIQLEIVALIHAIACNAPDIRRFERERNHLPFQAFKERIKKDEQFIEAAKKLDIKTLGAKFGATGLESKRRNLRGLAL